MKLNYTPPCNSDIFTEKLKEQWNESILSEYKKQINEFKSFIEKKEFSDAYFKIDFEEMAVKNPVSAVRWFADPAEPTFCQGEKLARTLSDWGKVGRHNLHNEYCEYAIIHTTDNDGKKRMKRIQFTTELREYWLLIAKHEPNLLKQLVSEVLGINPLWEDLYGIPNPHDLSPELREYFFCIELAGSGGNEALEKAGVPKQPKGKLNTDNALFMTHPINGLDDLIYIVLFGAQPFASKRDGQTVRCTKQQIFTKWGVQHLACRHADPAAAMGAYSVVFDGAKVSFSNTLGVFIHSFNLSGFKYIPSEGKESIGIPENWVKYSRNNQRLEFGPSDEEDFFLDDIILEEGDDQNPLSGGYDVAKKIEVGPFLYIDNLAPMQDENYIFLDQQDKDIVCVDAEVCNRIAVLKNEYYRKQLNSLDK